VLPRSRSVRARRNRKQEATPRHLGLSNRRAGKRQLPLGQKAISHMAQVMIESQAVGAKYGEQAGRKAMVEVLNEHPELQKALEEAGARKN
jgi:hypothetical protein